MRVNDTLLLSNIGQVCKNAHEEYGDPGEADVIKRDRSLERIVALALALGVVVVPINAGVIVDERDVTVWHCGTVAHQVS